MYPDKLMKVVDAKIPFLTDLAMLSDLTRCRILRLLEGRELTVGELADALQLPQSTVSRHLRMMADERWVRVNRDGTSRKHILETDRLPEELRELWSLTRLRLSSLPVDAEDQERLRAVLLRRRTRSREFFAEAAGDWDRLRDELFGEGSFLYGLPALLDQDWVVGDLGCGTGQVTEALAPFVRRVVAVDESESMLAVARERLGEHSHVEFHRAELENLPVPDASLDAATLVLVLHHIPEPTSVLAEAARVLRPDGRLLIVDTVPHERSEYQHRMGHVNLGFSSDVIRDSLFDAGFDDQRYERLPFRPGARGPALFAAGARRDGTRPVRRLGRAASPAKVE
jgi:ArsR family transcriptional regulator